MASATTCSECSATFASRPRKRTCSEACARIRARRIRASRLPGRRDEVGRLVLPCAVCGREYRAERGRRTCSDACAAERIRGQQRRSHAARYRADPEAARERQRARRRANLEEARAAERARAARARPAPELRQCSRCDEVYVAPRRDSRYCSSACREPRPEIACAVCDRRFRARRGTVYCGRACAQERDRERRRAAKRAPRLDEVTLAALALTAGQRPGRYEVECGQCGARFRAHRPHARWCSATCRSTAYAAERRGRRGRRRRTPLALECQTCGRRFQADRRTAVACSPACRAERNRALQAVRAADPAVRERAAKLARDRSETIAHARCVVCRGSLADLPDLRRNRYTCSPACRAEAARRRRRRAYHKRRDRE